MRTRLDILDEVLELDRDLTDLIEQINELAEEAKEIEEDDGDSGAEYLKCIESYVRSI